MAVQRDDQGRPILGRSSPGSKTHASMPWLPMPVAPANDNEVELVWIVRAFFGRHLNWLLPTLALAAFSLTLLFLRT